MSSLRRLLLKFDSRIIVIGGFLLAIVSWFFDAAVDVIFFATDDSYWQSALQPNGHEIWMRLFVSFMLIVLSLLAAALLKLHGTNEEEMTYKRVMMEKFTADLERQNIQLQKEIDLRKQAQQRLAEIAVSDPLTGIFNRRKFDEMMDVEIRRETRYPRGLSLIIFDIDFFKRINDEFGHAVGDRVLRQLVMLIAKNTRDADNFFRIGGEEFALLTYAENREELTDAAERFRLLAHGHDFELDRPVNISLGATTFIEGDTADSLFKRADDALYEAKGSGRNKVVLL